MNLDELANTIRSISEEKDVQKLADRLMEWKQNKETAEDLNHSIERYIGHIRVNNDEDHNKIYNMWSSFRDNAIIGIRGMTMIERLYWFCLLDEFEACHNEQAKLKIYHKLMANP